MSQYGLIGRRLGHSFSPQVHALLGEYEYGLYPIEPEDLPGFILNTKLSGFNVTIPYKQDVIPFCEKLTDKAKNLSSVNTVIRQPDGTFLGDNTDYYGFFALLGSDADKLRGKKALVLGSGGASKTVNAVLRDAGLSPVVTVSRTGGNNYNNLSRHYNAALIVNATPVGMYPNNGVSPIDLEPFSDCRLVLDLIYNPAKTKLLLQAENLGIPCRNGLLMLAAQAAAASEMFQNIDLPEHLPEEIAGILSQRMKNIALIGMPGSGKTTIGTLLSELTGRRFFDTDGLICEEAGTDIPAIFAKHGEKYFRALETSVLEKVSKENGAVIATGGGIVTIPENQKLLMQNSTVVLIESDINNLSADGRPISLSVGAEEIFKKRQPLYLSWSEHKFYNHDNDPQKTALEIKEALRL